MNARPAALPEGALLERYLPGPDAASHANYVDCFRADIEGRVALGSYVAVFYRTRLFRLERTVLGRLWKRPSTDTEAIAVASGDARAFAAWTVEARTADQLLMRAVDGRTRSWFMVRPASGRTVLFFGSAVLPAPGDGSASALSSVLYRVLLPVHRVYSVLLLGAAQRKLARDRRDHRAQ